MGRGTGGIRSSSAPRVRQAARQPAAGNQAAESRADRRRELKRQVRKSLGGLGMGKKAKENGKNINIKVNINKQGRSHIAEDMLNSKKLGKIDATKLKTMFRNSTFVKDKPKDPDHDSKSGGKHFYYFKARGHEAYFNVAKVDVKDEKGKIIGVEYHLYSITTSIRK